MSFADPARLDLSTLFRDTSMFDSRRAWSRSGFTVIDRPNNGKIMVARHPSAAGLLFKKYVSDVSDKDQLRNYERRVEGSNRLRAFVAEQRLSRVTIPRKWLLELPRSFSAEILVVEQLDLLSDTQTSAAYRRIDPDLLRQLCTVLFHFRGMDSNVKNVPFVADGRIAFIDTEHWDRRTSKSYLYHIEEHLSAVCRKAAKKIFDRLEDGGSVRVDDFSFEEDTSASSSFSSSSFSSSS